MTAIGAGTSETSTCVEVSVDTRLFDIGVVKKVMHRFLHRATSTIELLAEGQVKVRLQAKSSQPVLSLEQDFRDALVEQDWREAVAKKTEAFKNLIVAQAFSPLSLITPKADTEDFHGDPLGISVPDRAK